MAAAARQAPADEVCLVVPAKALPAGRASTDADRLPAVVGSGGTPELLMTLMLPTDM